MFITYHWFSLFLVQSKVPIKEVEDIADFFLPDDDAALAELNLNDLEGSFEIPEKKMRFEWA